MKYSIKSLQTITQNYISNSGVQIPDGSTRDLLLAIHTLGADGTLTHALEIYNISPARFNAIYEAAYRTCDDSRTAAATVQQNLAPYSKSITEIIESIILWVISNYDSTRKNLLLERKDFQKYLCEGVRVLEGFPE